MNLFEINKIFDRTFKNGDIHSEAHFSIEFIIFMVLIARKKYYNVSKNVVHRQSKIGPGSI